MGMLSYNGDTLPDTNVLELGLPTTFVDPDGDHDFIGKAALQRIAKEGVKRHFVGIKFNEASTVCDEMWRGKLCPVLGEHMHEIGCMTAIAYSPRFDTNLGLAILSSHIRANGARVKVEMASGGILEDSTSSLPFAKAGRDRKAHQEYTSSNADGLIALS